METLGFLGWQQYSISCISHVHWQWHVRSFSMNTSFLLGACSEPAELTARAGKREDCQEAFVAWLDHQRLHLASILPNARQLLLGRLCCPLGGIGRRWPFNARPRREEGNPLLPEIRRSLHVEMFVPRLQNGYTKWLWTWCSVCCLGIATEQHVQCRLAHIVIVAFSSQK